MFDTQKTFHDSGILDVIKILSANGASGRLDITAGTAEAMIFFKDGLLVDARVGHLTGFPAVNAVAAIRDARFNFDATAVPPLVSSVTPNERVVLKQFFGIEGVRQNEAQQNEAYPDEVTMETTGIPVETLPTPVQETPPSNSFFRGALVFAAVFIILAVAAVALRNKYREQALPASVATAEQPATTEQPVPTEQPATTERREAPSVAEDVKPTNPSPSTDQSVAARDLTGKWNVVNTVQKTAYRSFQNLKIGFDLSISQNGKSFTGSGRKVSENGRSLPANSQTPIHVRGSIDGDRVEATFFEEGTERKTNGRFVWRIDKTGSLSGTFVSTAASSSGKSAARKSS